MASPCTETVVVQLTPYERTLIEGLAAMRDMAASDLVRELMGLGCEHEICRTPPCLRLVSA